MTGVRVLRASLRAFHAFHLPSTAAIYAAVLGKWNAWKARKEARKTLTPVMQAGD